MRIEEETKLDFSDVLIRPKRSNLSSRQDVSLVREILCKHSGRILKGIPIMNSNMGTSGTFDIARILDANNCFSTVHKFHGHKQWVREMSKGDNPKGFSDRIFFPVGMDSTSLETHKRYVNSIPDNLIVKNFLIDVANGYTEKFVKFTETIRSTYPDAIIVAGNVATPDMTEALILAGADIVKIGIGSGSCCTTRLKAAVGYPQLSAAIECADAAHGLGGHIISDGGCTTVADFAKALGAGADIVMSGSFFAATDESDCETTEDGNGNIFKVNYGMSSKTAQDKYGAGLKNYRSSEGRTVLLRPSGPTSDVIQDILGGIRSCCTYVGAKKIKELPKRTTFIKVNNTHNRVNEENTIGN